MVLYNWVIPTEPASLDLPRVGTQSTEPSLTRVRLCSGSRCSCRSFAHAARYDSMRLETYRQKENLADRICVSSIGSAVALRFDDVGYFNRVYCAEQTFLEDLPEIEAFYPRRSPLAASMVAPPSDESGSVSISRPGWAPAHHYAWPGSPRLQVNSGRFRPTPFDIRPSKTFRATAVPALRICGRFEAQEDRIPGRPAEHATSI